MKKLALLLLPFLALCQPAPAFAKYPRGVVQRQYLVPGMSEVQVLSTLGEPDSTSYEQPVLTLVYTSDFHELDLQFTRESPESPFLLKSWKSR